MDEIKNKLWTLPFAKNFESSKIDKLFELGKIVRKKKSDLVSRQFEESHSFYLLIEGKVNFTISVENSNDEFAVGSSGYKFTPIGWSGFLPPYRYATTVTCDEDSVLFRWSHSSLKEFFKKETGLGYEFTMFVFQKSVILLNQVRIQLTKYSNTDWDLIFSTDFQKVNTPNEVFAPEPITLLRKSSFFDAFPERLLCRLADLAQRKTYSQGQRLYTQGEDADGIYMLAAGNVALCFNKFGIGKLLNDQKIQESVYLRMINYSGDLVGWAGYHPEMKNDVTAVATSPAVIYYFKREDLKKVFFSNPADTLNFIKRLLWLVSNLLRNARARLVSEHFEHEITAIKSIIDQNSTQLSVNSKLHKLPSLLKQVITHDEAFSILHNLEAKGNALEKGLSKLSLDILGGAYIEHKFYTGLKNVYQTVVDCPENLSKKDISTLSAKKFLDIFEQVPHVIQGWENLPDSAGHIFIYNHLVNSRYYTLANNFQMTLDSNFIKSMILFKKYGDPGIGVVRIPKAQEYAHQNYYRRLGLIYVYTKESELSNNSKAQRKQQNRRFFEQAGAYLKDGVNLMISPEGKSLRTSDSPSLFKSGAFRLAAGMDPEPLIVPLVIANFDKRINNNTLCLIIKKPFRISELVKDPLGDKDSIDDFLEDFINTYRGYVQEAVRLADKVSSDKINLRRFEQNAKEVA